MKILVISDTHGDTARLTQLLKLHSDADHIIFLGDGLEDFEACHAHLACPLWCVRGNVDFNPALWGDAPEWRVIELGGYRIFACHGHSLDAKGGMGNLIVAASIRGCDLALYGHTHLPDEQYIQGDELPLYLFNPGSLGRPRFGNPSYGLITISDSGILLSHGTLPLPTQR
ncbi:MAG: metallophosphoesterase [Clostridia bacterium]|nr:metallophosphoesterase [Clostridia bacterium]